jgi:hypothetical protein
LRPSQGNSFSRTYDAQKIGGPGFLKLKGKDKQIANGVGIIENKSRKERRGVVKQENRIFKSDNLTQLLMVVL